MKKNKNQLIFFGLDIILIIIASYGAFLLRLDGVIPASRMIGLYAFIVLAVLTTPVIFYLFNLYKKSWAFVSLTDLPVILKGVGVSSLFLGTILYILRDHRFFLEFPRSIIFIYAILLFFLIGLLRFSKRIYWQIMKSNDNISKPEKSYVLPLTSKEVDDHKPKNILITGGAGYIGSVLSRMLLDSGYQVKVVDKLLFGDSSIRELLNNPNFEFIKGDILDTNTMTKALTNVDAVVNLAAIVGEPACLSRKALALKTNYLGPIYLARACKSLGIKRFIQASTCSTYGQQDNGSAVKESASLFPVDFYGETKIYAERELMKLMDANFNPTILRLSTVYGLSPRMRFDLVVNILTKKAVQDKEIFIFGGDQWRPLIHVSDVSRSIIAVLESSVSVSGNQVYNVGGNDENYLVSKIGELVKEEMPDIRLETIEGIEDKRSYKVDFDKISKSLGFSVSKRVKDGIIEIKEALNNNRFINTEDKKYYNHLV